jgi:hypothetical protein
MLASCTGLARESRGINTRVFGLARESRDINTRVRFGFTKQLAVYLKV